MYQSEENEATRNNGRKKIYPVSFFVHKNLVDQRELSKIENEENRGRKQKKKYKNGRQEESTDNVRGIIMCT